jgi:hypothetical protein
VAAVLKVGEFSLSAPPAVALCTNKPEYLSAGAMAGIWLSFVLATGGIVGVSAAAARWLRVKKFF